MTEANSRSEDHSKKRSIDLTEQDFAENKLPQRPLRYQPEYRQDIRHFVFICGGVMVFIAALSLSQLF